MRLISWWVALLRSVVLLGLVGMFGDSFPEVSYVPGAGSGRKFQCPLCGRVELTLLEAPFCPGVPDLPHRKVRAEPLPMDSDLAISDDRQIFD